jgi:hypothetical protein
MKILEKTTIVGSRSIIILFFGPMLKGREEAGKE